MSCLLYRTITNSQLSGHYSVDFLEKEEVFYFNHSLGCVFPSLYISRLLDQVYHFSLLICDPWSFYFHALMLLAFWKWKLPLFNGRKHQKLTQTLTRSWLFQQGGLTLSRLWVWWPHLQPQSWVLVALVVLGKIVLIRWEHRILGFGQTFFQVEDDLIESTLVDLCEIWYGDCLVCKLRDK